MVGPPHYWAPGKHQGVYKHYLSSSPAPLGQLGKCVSILKIRKLRLKELNELPQVTEQVSSKVRDLEIRSVCSKPLLHSTILHSQKQKQSPLWRLINIYLVLKIHKTLSTLQAPLITTATGCGYLSPPDRVGNWGTERSATCPRPLSWKVAELGCKPSCPGSRAILLHHWAGICEAIVSIQQMSSTCVKAKTHNTCCRTARQTWLRGSFCHRYGDHYSGVPQ